MKSSISYILLAACLSVLCFVAGAQPPPGPNQAPPDIAADSWLPITSTLGFVITGGGAPDMPRPRSVSTVTGYFMALKDGTWVRLDIAPPPARSLDARRLRLTKRCSQPLAVPDVYFPDDFNIIFWSKARSR